MRLFLAIVIALSCIGAATAQWPSVKVKAGNVFVSKAGRERQLTRFGRDADAALSPDGRFVVFTRRNGKPSADDPQLCLTGAQADRLHRVDLDTGKDEILLTGHSADRPPQQLCGFDQKQFSSDGRRLYFLSPAWVTSAALHSYDFGTRTVKFVAPANDVIVLSFCRGKHRDQLVLTQHRYFLGGGSYDWYWLFDAAGKKEIGPVGDENETVKSITDKAKDVICQD
jgi:hypothetical protein